MAIREVQLSEIDTIAGGGDDDSGDIVVTGTRTHESNQLDNFDLSRLSGSAGGSGSGSGGSNGFGVRTWTLPAPPPSDRPVQGNPPTKTIGGLTYTNGNSTYGIGTDQGLDTISASYIFRF